MIGPSPARDPKAHPPGHSRAPWCVISLTIHRAQAHSFVMGPLRHRPRRDRIRPPRDSAPNPLHLHDRATDIVCRGPGRPPPGRHEHRARQRVPRVAGRRPQDGRFPARAPARRASRSSSTFPATRSGPTTSPRRSSSPRAQTFVIPPDRVTWRAAVHAGCARATASRPPTAPSSSTSSRSRARTS